jgi:predicted RNA-binding Zn-ribbon protein involved in translation (DUF1610 family)
MSDYLVRIGCAYVADDGLLLDLPGSSWDQAQTGTCPDCGGTWVWAEAGNVPGTRECTSCGSQFSVRTSTRPWHLRRERTY